MTSYTCRAILSLCICAWLAHAAEHQTKDVSLGLYKTSNLLEAKAASEASSMEVSGTLARSLKQRKTIRQQPQKQLHRPTHEQLAMATRLPTTVQQLLFEYDAKSWFPVAQHMARIQRQQDCEAARYLLIDDINTVSGMGWSILTMVSGGRCRAASCSNDCSQLLQSTDAQLASTVKPSSRSHFDCGSTCTTSWDGLLKLHGVWFWHCNLYRNGLLPALSPGVDQSGCCTVM